MTVVEWVLIVAVIVLYILVILLWRRDGEVVGVPGEDCCDDVRKWAPKIDKWKKDLRDYLVDTESAICTIAEKVRTGQTDVPHFPFCNDTGDTPPKNSCDFTQC